MSRSMKSHISLQLSSDVGLYGFRGEVGMVITSPRRWLNSGAGTAFARRCRRGRSTPSAEGCTRPTGTRTPSP